MPLYEYECEGGHRFEELHSIENRHNAICPVCKKSAHLKMSAWGRVIFAGPFTVYAHDGTILHRTQTTERTPPPDYRLDNPNLVEA